MNKSLKNVLIVLPVLLTLVGAIIGTHSYLAKASDLELVALRLDIKIQNDRYNAVRERMWNLEGRYGDDCKLAPEEVKVEYRKLLLELEQIRRELDRMKLD